MLLHSELRSVPLVLNNAGQVPTLPNPLGLKVNSNGWKRTDLAEGEFCTNSADSKIFVRLNNTIVELPTTMTSSGGSNSYFPSGW